MVEHDLDYLLLHSAIEEVDVFFEGYVVELLWNDLVGFVVVRVIGVAGIRCYRIWRVMRGRFRWV